MNTIRIENASNARVGDSSTVAPDDTLQRSRPEIPDPQFDDDESPIMRIVRTHDRTTSPKQIASGADRAAGLPVTVLTTDGPFANQLRAALDGTNEVTVVGDVDSAAALAVSGRCPILITDTIVTRGALEQLSARVRAHEHAAAVVVAGNRDQGSLFISLQSSGVVDGFLLKPATSAATQIVIESATRRYRTGAERLSEGATQVRGRTGRRVRAPASMDAGPGATSTIEARRPQRAIEVAATPVVPAPLPTPASARRGPSWTAVAALLVVISAIAAWFVWQRPVGIDGTQIVGRHLALAESALLSGRLLDARDGAVHHFQTVLAIEPNNFAASRGLDAVASALSRQVQQHMTNERVADSVVSLERLREFQPKYAELPLLESQLHALQERVAAAHVPPTVERQAELSTAKPAAPPRDQPRAVAAREKPSSTADIGERAPVAPTATGSSAHQVDPLASASSAPTTSPTAAKPAPAPTPPAMAREPVASDVRAPAETRAASIAPPPLRSSASNAAAITPPIASAPAQQQKTLQSPALQKYVPPVYPPEALSRHMEGWIELSMEITPSGEVLRPRVENGDKRQLFAKPALAAVKQWQYAPDTSRVAGERSSVRVEFKLE